MKVLAIVAGLLLGQEPAAEPPATPQTEEPTTAPAPSASPESGATRPSRVNAEEIARQIERIRALPAAPNSEDDGVSAEQSEPEQVRAFASSYFRRLIAGDSRGLVLRSGFPYFLEDRRLESPDEVQKGWLKNLRAKRTDLLALNTVEVLTPQEMEKKYGKPPARLNNMPWRASKTYLAVGNLSGHAAVLVVKQSSSGWSVVGFHD